MSNGNSGSEEAIPRKKYKRWKYNHNVPIPLKTRQRWEKRGIFVNENINCDPTTPFNVVDNGNIQENCREEGLEEQFFTIDEISDIQENYQEQELEEQFESNDFGHIDHDNKIINDNIDNMKKRHEEESSNTHFNNLQRNLYANATVTVKEAVLEVMNSFIRHKFTKALLQQHLNTLHKLLPKPNNLPKSTFKMLQFTRNIMPAPRVIKHFYCRNCLSYCGPIRFVDQCPHCESNEGNNFFYEFDVEDQIRQLFEYRNLADKLQITTNEPNIINDITDGAEYLRIKSAAKLNKYDLTLIMNTDGIALKKSSKSHFWPLMFTIAELPEHLRESHIIVIGLWYDANKKPIMNSFLKPFCDKIASCFNNGIVWTHPDKHTVHKSKIVAPLFIADAPARALIQNTMSYNAIFGCNLCEIEMELCQYKEGQKRKRVYMYREKESKLRSSDSMKKHAYNVVTKRVQSEKGVRGYTIISYLPFIDISTCVLPEFMHSVLLGVAKQFIVIWVKKKGPWNIAHSLDSIDDSVSHIKPPYFFNRMLRNLSSYKLYKASEFYNWILYYSVPILKKFLPKKYFQHWLLLVLSLFTLLKKPIRIHPDLKRAEIFLRMFVRDIKTLYGEYEYTYNVHQLLHLVLCVKRWGPLWATSAFPFENYNGIIGNSIHGSKHLGQEIVNNLIIAQDVQVLNSRTLNFCTQNCNERTKFKLFNEIAMIENFFIHRQSDFFRLRQLMFTKVKFYAKASINQVIFTSQMYKELATNSYTVYIKLNNQRVIYGLITAFYEINGNLYLIINKLHIDIQKLIQHEKTASQLQSIIPVQEGNQFMSITFENISIINHLIYVYGYVCKRPNQLNKTM